MPALVRMDVKLEEKISLQGEDAMRLRNWFIEEHGGVRIAHGNVEGNPRFEDGTFIHTSGVREVREDGEKGISIRTRNSIYECAWEDCAFHRQMPLEGMRQRMDAFGERQELPPSLPSECVFLSFSSEKEFYFQRGAVRKKGRTTWISMYPHIGMFQDSCILMVMEGVDLAESSIDIRYFPGLFDITFYMFETSGLPAFFLNEGKCAIHFVTEMGLPIKVGGNIQLEPGEIREYPEPLSG